MTNKMRLMHKVWYSDLSATQKMILTYLISKADENGRAWPKTARLAQVAGIKHEKNFKGVAHYLPGLVEVRKIQTDKGLQNEYLLSTPAIEGLPEAEVILKNTERRGTTPSSADTTPATEGVTTPASEGSTTPSTEGTNRTSKRTLDRTRERTTPATPVEVKEEEVTPSPLSTSETETPLNNEQEDQETQDYLGLSNDHKRFYRQMKKDDPFGFSHARFMERLELKEVSEEW